MKLENPRRISQALFLAATLLGLVGITTTGLIYPYFFCYSCPWDVGNCPLGLMEHGFVDIQIMLMVGVALLLFLFGFLSLVGALFGRAFCGWACPMGALQDLARKTRIPDLVRRKLRPRVNPLYKYVKYLILLAIPVTAYLSRDLFYTNLCPVGGVTGTVPTLLFYSSEWVFGSTFPVKVTSMVLFSLLIILVARGWCKYLCPIGAYLAPWNRVCGIGVTRDCGSCKDCGLCEKKCPMDVGDIGKRPDPECVLCGRCVDSCKFGSLKLGIRPFGSKKAMAVWAALLLVSSAMIAGGMMLETTGYERADEINSLPCLGCLALDPYMVSEWRTSTEAQPSFVAEALDSRPVFLHYRTDVCPGCDEMEPHIAILEEQYGDRVQFIHINLDHADEEQDASYDIYDFAGTPDARFGVPMFSTVIVEMNGSAPEIRYNTQYGSSSDQGETKRQELEATILEALDRHVASAAPINPATPSDATVFTELYVDTGCVNCYKSEDALVELQAEEETNFVTFITNAPDVSGTYATYREQTYDQELDPTLVGHPWVIFAGGPGNVMGALTTEEARADYLAGFAAADLAPLNISLSGTLESGSGTLHSNITVSNTGTAAADVRIEAFLVEKVGRWLNLQGDPIPNAFIDLLANDTYSVAAGASETIPVAWTGTTAVQPSDLRMGNTAIVLVAWSGETQITCAVIESDEPDALSMAADGNLKAALPDNMANFTFTVTNYQASAVTLNLTVDRPANWDARLSAQSITVPANGNATFALALTGNGTASTDPAANFTVEARNVLDPTMLARSKVQVEVKDDITPPVVISPEHSPEVPRADQLVNITVTVGDNTGVASVKVSYFSCTPEACSPYFMFDMNLTTGNEYAASVRPIGTDHTDLHYKIIATDIYGNTVTTQLYDVELEPVEAHHTDTTATEKPKWIGVVVLVIFAVIAVIVALTGREKPGKPAPSPEAEGPTKEAKPEPPKQQDKSAARARIQKAYDEGRITKEQYDRNMEKFRE